MPARLRSAAPRIEILMAASTLIALALIPSGRPWVSIAYAITGCSGFAALSLYWWVAERSQSEEP